MKKSVAIIGGGPSAIICAIFASKNNDVTLFCKEECVGKKILVTGNGRCNLTNKFIENNSYNLDISKFLQKFNQFDLINYFKSIGLECYFDEQGRAYPISNSAQSVKDVLSNQLNNIKINTNCEVFDIKIDNNFKIISNLGEFAFDRVVICTGSDDLLISKLNIQYKKFYPSLVALKTKQDTKRLSGLKLSNVCVYCGNEKQFGEVLFKDKGLSGICIFNISSFLARNNDYNKKIYIDLLPKLSYDEVFLMINNRKRVKDMKMFMLGLFHKEVNLYILKRLGLENANGYDLSQTDIQNIAKLIKKLDFDVVSTYDNYQVKSGGVKLIDLDDNLQYKFIKNLYFAGEVVDVDGLCGGYNLQWAFTSGKIVGENL